MAVRDEIDFILPYNPKITTCNNINDILFKKTNTMKIMYLNCRSINNKIEELEVIIKNICLKNNTIIHLIILSETWISRGNATYFNFNNYNCELSCRTTNFGGSAILIHQSITSYEIFNCYEDNDINIIGLNLRLDGKQQSVSSVYRAPNIIVAWNYKNLQQLWKNIYAK